MTIGERRRAGPRWWAVAALASLVVVAAGLVQVVVGSRDQLLQLLVGTVLSVAVMAATAWWAFTTRRVWKRWLNLAVATLAVASIVLGFLEFGFRQAAGAAAIVLGSLAYATTARRALRPRARRVGGLEPGEPLLVVDGETDDGRPTRQHRRRPGAAAAHWAHRRRWMDELATIVAALDSKVSVGPGRPEPLVRGGQLGKRSQRLLLRGRKGMSSDGQRLERRRAT